MLTRTGFGDHTGLAHALGQQGLADGVVDLVGARVVQVFALEVDLSTTDFTAQAGRVIDRAGASHEVGQLTAKLSLELVVVTVVFVDVLELLERVDQGLGHKGAAVGAKVASGIGLLVIQHLKLGNHSAQARPGRSRCVCAQSIGCAHRLAELAHPLGILDALGRLHAGTDIHGPGPHSPDALDHIVDVQPP